MKQQRICGIALILISVLLVLLAAQGTTPEESDITVVIFLFPLGVYALFTKTPITYAAQREAAEQELPEL